MSRWVGETTRWFHWARDRAYDTVFHVGDTTQQFLWDAVYGPENSRHSSYLQRQYARQGRMQPESKPLSFDDREIFENILVRQSGERLTDFWKRRKALLASPNKHQIVAEYRELQKQADILTKKSQSVEARNQQKKLEEEFRQIRSLRYAWSQSQKPTSSSRS